MSWASRRRGIYLLGVIAFLIVLISVPIIQYTYRPSTCADGKQNQGETAPDKGGPCPVLDERVLSPASVLWSRSFSVRDGSYSSVAYVQNDNVDIGVKLVHYKFGLYDSRNVLVAERAGRMFVMPSSITPVYEMNIDTGNRDVAHTYFEFTEPLAWGRFKNAAADISVSNREIRDAGTSPRLTATVENVSIAPINDISFVTVVFDPAGNARAASMTALSRLNAGEKQQIIFTWPAPFKYQVGKIDIFPLVPPALIR